MYDSENILKVFTAFSGYDSQCMALDRLGIPYDLVGWSEIDRFAIQAHGAVFPQWSGRNFGDISKIDWTDVPDFDLFTYSFPCTDISSAGKQEGLAEGSGTRSSLLWECRKAIEVKRPRYLLMENVKNLVSKKFMPFFREWERYLAGLGYINFYKVMNAKDYGVPKNRERVFLVSVLDEDAAFHFPEPFTLEKRLKDVLEKDVDEIYYLKESTVKGIIPTMKKHHKRNNGFSPGILTEDDVIAHCVTSHLGFAITDNMIAEPVIIQKSRGFNKGGIHKECPSITSNSFECNNLVFEPEWIIGSMQVNAYKGSVDNISPCIATACGMGGGQTPMIIEVCNVNPSGRGLNGRVVSAEGLVPTLSTNKGEGMKVLLLNGVAYRIRKLTPRECFRLMDVSEENIDRIQKSGISNSQQYRMAGNSIVVACLYYIFKNMFIDTRKEGVLF